MRKNYSNFIVGFIALISALLFSSVFLSCNNDVSESHETSFTVTIDQDLQNYVYSDKDSAKQGETVTLTTQAYNGKEVSSISVRTTSNTEISCLPSAKSMYTFIMPNTNVVITGVLKTVEGSNLPSENQTGLCEVTAYIGSFLLYSEFSLEGVEVTVYDASHNVIAILNSSNTTFSYNSPDMSTEGYQTVTLSFTYNGINYSTSYLVLIYEAGSSFEPGNCAVTMHPYFYLADSEFSLDGVEVTVYDAGPVVLDSNNTTFIYEAPDMTQDGEQTVTLSFTYNGKKYSAAYSAVIYKPNPLVVIKQYPYHMCYFLEDELTLDGLSVVVYEEDGTTIKDTLTDNWKWTERISLDTYAKGTRLCKVDFDAYDGNEHYTVFFQIKVLNSDPADAYVINYTGEDVDVDEDIIKDNFIRISLSPSVTKIDALQYYSLKRKILAANPGKVIYDKLPANLPYYLDIPDGSHSEMGYGWEGEKKCQWDLMIDFIKDFGQFYNFTTTWPTVSDDGYYEDFNLELTLKREIMYKYPETVHHESDGTNYITLEFIPGINFIYALDDSGSYPILTIQVDSNIQLFVSGTINLYFNWDPYFYTDPTGNWNHYTEEVKPIFWLNEGASVKINDWSKITFVGYTDIINYKIIEYWNLQYALQLFGFFDVNFTNANNLPVMEFEEISIDDKFVKTSNGDHHGDFGEGLGCHAITGFTSGIYGEIDSSCVTNFKGGRTYNCLNKSIIGDLVKLYNKFSALDKLRINRINSPYDKVSGRQTDDDPTLYIGNEVNPNCPKMPVSEWIWWLKANVDVENMCITDDGTNYNINNTGRFLDDGYSYGDMSNLRFEIDLTNVNLHGWGLKGIVDFAGDAPTYFDYTPARIIFRKITHEVKVYYFPTLDITDLSTAETSKITIYGTETRRPPYIFELIANENNSSIIPYGAGYTRIGLSHTFRTREEDERSYISDGMVPDFDSPAVYVFEGKHSSSYPVANQIASKNLFNQSFNKIIINATVIDYGIYLNQSDGCFLEVYLKGTDSRKEEGSLFNFGKINEEPSQKSYSLEITDSQIINDIKENGLWMDGAYYMGCKISVNIE